MTDRKVRTTRTPMEIAADAQAQIRQQVDKALDKRASLLEDLEKQIARADAAFAKAEKQRTEIAHLGVTIEALLAMLPKEQPTFTSVELDEV